MASWYTPEFVLKRIRDRGKATGCSACVHETTSALRRFFPDDGTTPCADCGWPHGLCSGSYWLADDALWAEVVGRDDIALCMPCFTERARHRGVSLHWRPVVERRAAC